MDVYSPKHGNVDPSTHILDMVYQPYILLLGIEIPKIWEVYKQKSTKTCSLFQPLLGWLFKLFSGWWLSHLKNIQVWLDVQIFTGKSLGNHRFCQQPCRRLGLWVSTIFRQSRVGVSENRAKKTVSPLYPGKNEVPMYWTWENVHWDFPTCSHQCHGFSMFFPMKFMDFPLKPSDNSHGFHPNRRPHTRGPELFKVSFCRLQYGKTWKTRENHHF